MDRMIVIAVFRYPADAQTLMALLRSEGIECYLRNELSAQNMGCYMIVGEARLEILEKDLPRALEIMRENGYPIPGGDICNQLVLRKKMDRMVVIAVFSYPADAQTLMALLRSEGIECYLRNELTAQIMAGYVDVGGARLEILEKDLPRALEIMRENGYPLPGDGTKEYARRLKLLDICFPFLKKQRPEVRILVAFASVAIVLALAIFALSLLMSN